MSNSDLGIESDMKKSDPVDQGMSNSDFGIDQDNPADQDMRKSDHVVQEKSKSGFGIEGMNNSDLGIESDLGNSSSFVRFKRAKSTYDDWKADWVPQWTYDDWNLNRAQIDFPRLTSHIFDQMKLPKGFPILYRVSIDFSVVCLPFSNNYYYSTKNFLI